MEGGLCGPPSLLASLVQEGPSSSRKEPFPRPIDFHCQGGRRKPCPWSDTLPPASMLPGRPTPPPNPPALKVSPLPFPSDLKSKLIPTLTWCHSPKATPPAYLASHMTGYPCSPSPHELPFCFSPLPAPQLLKTFPYFSGTHPPSLGLERGVEPSLLTSPPCTTLPSPLPQLPTPHPSPCSLREALGRFCPRPLPHCRLDHSSLRLQGLPCGSGQSIHTSCLSHSKDLHRPQWQLFIVIVLSSLVLFYFLPLFFPALSSDTLIPTVKIKSIDLRMS